MASSTSAPSRPLSNTGHQRLSSLTSRQRRMGPAPLASFEDLSMDKADSSPEGLIPLPQIGEEPSPTGNKTILDVPTSPTIRVSAASSPSQNDSKESTPEKEHYAGYTKSEYCDIEMTEIRSSTEEFNAEDQEKARRRQERSKMIVEIDKREEALKISELIRKGSSSSVLSDGLLPITSGHSSRLSSLGSIGSPIRRSPSPHKMLLETSFCGSKPILNPSIDIEDPPITSASVVHETIENINATKSPFEAKCPDIFRTPSQKAKLHKNTEENVEKEIEASPKPSHPLDSSKLKQELTKSLQRRHEQQRRQAEHHEYQQRLVDQGEVFDRQTMGTFRTGRRNSREENLEYRTHSSERQSRLEKRSPRLGKKVPTPQVPELRDLPKTSPSSPSVSAQESRYSRSTRSSTPPGSPKSSKKGKKNKTHDNDDLNVTSTSRKSSFSSLFRRSENMSSPVTPDSPGSVNSGRKSPFSQFIKNAENKLRSRSRSRSRSKSRDRDLEDDTHDRRKKLSIFMPTKKKKAENEISEVDKPIAKFEESKLYDPIANVEFKFNSESACQSSTIGLNRSDNEASKTTTDSLHIDEVSNGQHPPFESEDSLDKLSSLMSEANRTESITENFSEEVTNSLREKEKEIMRQSGKLNDTEVGIRDEIDPIQPTEAVKPISPKSHINSLNSLNVHQDEDPDSLSISESEKISEVDYMKKKSKTSSRIDSPDAEIKGLVSQESFEDEELPYIPTTLPQERSFVTPMIPVKEREPKLKMTQSIDRPRSTTPIHPSKLEEYKQSSQEMLDQDLDKMTISIKVPAPGAVKVLPNKSPRRQDSKSWEDFCNEGLKSPRQLRRQLREKQQSSDDSNPPTPSSGAPFVSSFPSVAPSEARNWINFDEIPDIVLKPVRQIKTLPQKRQTPFAILKKDQGKANDSGVSDAFDDDKSQPFGENEDSSKESSIHSSEDSDDEKPTSVSSSEELNTVRETIEKLKKQSTEESYENSDLERLLAPVNECITKLSSLASQNESHMQDSRKSPIPDNWEDFLLPPQPGRRSRLSSIGSEAGSLGGLRSPSPSAVLLETSFCGSQPIDDPALEEPDISIPLARKLSGISFGDLSPLTPRAERGGSVHSAQYLCQPDRSSMLSDSSAESPKGSDYDITESHRGQSTHLNPFGMDLEVKSNRSSVISQDQSPPESPYSTTRHPS